MGLPARERLLDEAPRQGGQDKRRREPRQCFELPKEFPPTKIGQRRSAANAKVEAIGDEPQEYDGGARESSKWTVFRPGVE